MSQTLDQIFIGNPITTNDANDLMYFSRSPYSSGNDVAMLYSDFATQVGASLWFAGAGNGAVQSLNGSAPGDNSLAFGNSTSGGNNSLAFGNANTTAESAVAIGQAQATGVYSFAFGNNTQAGNSGNPGDYSFAFGNQSSTGGGSGGGNYSFAFGNGSNTGVVGSGNYSFVFGNGSSSGTSADSDYSFAFGSTCSTNGFYGFAFGNNAISNNNGAVVWGDSNATPNADTAVDQFNLTFANGYRFFGGSFNVETAGSGLCVAEGSNCKQGIATLSTGGTVSVMNSSVTANSRIFLTAQDANSTGSLYVSARVASTSFDITSNNPTDSGVVAYEIFEPAA
jgi:hypothetical protein